MVAMDNSKSNDIKEEEGGVGVGEEGVVTKMGVASDDSDTNPMIVASSDDADRDDNNNNSENNKSASTAATDAIHAAAPDREAKGEGGVATDDVIDAASDTPLSVHGDVEKRNDGMLLQS